MTDQKEHVQIAKDTIMNPNNIRLSRISHPRATFWAIALLVVVFLGFGVFAEAALHIQ
jgi:hypothetical protein